jgi:hypothetical protein
MDNVPQSIDGEDLTALFTSAAELAAARFAESL